MTSWEAILLGLIQGATEFLPISSSGHLVVGQALMGLEIPGVVFEVALHVATLVSVLIVYRKKVRELVAGILKRDREAWQYVGLLVLATVPAASLGLLLRGPVEALFESPAVVGGGFLFTGAVIWTSRGALAGAPEHHPGFWSALGMGMAQALALVPGVSRSGTTVVVGLWMGVEAEDAAEFSFLMAVPAIVGAAVLQIPDVMAGGGGVGGVTLLVGSLVAAVAGILAIWTFVGMLRRRAFHWFAPYLAVVGFGLLGWVYLW